ncbi:MAG: PLP-dependent aminotransferase family protein [Ideonella sp.]|nr:PLP-dependent aminotransferase family protein [Ideonella sp.]MCC7455575.1 PLP-dependent aminotransferase family protein [Nitrospira sp.]
MQVPVHLSAEAARTLQEQLFDELVRQIEDGRLKPGMQMPATRQLAADLGISRNTVSLVYEKLSAEGFIEGKPPQGTFVTALGARSLLSRGAPATGPAPRQPAGPRTRTPFPGIMHALHPPRVDGERRLEFDFWVGRPDPRLFPAQTWRGLIERSLAGMQHGDGSYGEPAGLAPLRKAVANHVGAARGIVCSADEVVITNGIQEGINIVARLLLRGDACVGMEHPGYAGAANVFASYDAQLLPVSVDDEGAVPGALPARCRLMYLTPAHQYPSGVTLSMQRRREWLHWAAQCGGYLIEDDYDCDFYYDSAPLPAMKAGDKADQVIYLGTFSKSLAAGMRLGYMIVPRELRDEVATVKGLLTNGSPWLVQTSMAEFIDSGEFVHHLRRLRRHYAARRDALARALAHDLGTVRLTGTHAGMHVLWQPGPDLPPIAEIERRARAQGVGVYDLRRGNAWVEADRLEPRWERSLLLGYAALDEQEIAAGIERLLRALRRG